MFPRRSGAEVVYLEQAYPRPRFLISTSFAVTTILMSFSASNAIVLAQYTLTALKLPVTDYHQTLVALAVVFVTVGGVGLSTKWSLRVVKFLTIIKMLSLAFMVVTGVAVLLGLTSIEDPYANFHNLFEGSKKKSQCPRHSLGQSKPCLHWVAQRFQRAWRNQRPDSRTNRPEIEPNIVVLDVCPVIC